jgi:hypothetical protein
MVRDVARERDAAVPALPGTTGVTELAWYAWAFVVGYALVRRRT